jgi:hypothetical protein
VHTRRRAARLNRIHDKMPKERTAPAVGSLRSLSRQFPNTNWKPPGALRECLDIVNAVEYDTEYRLAEPSEQGLPGRNRCP